MKRTIILSLAGITGATALAISQLAPTDPNSVPTPAPKETESAQPAPAEQTSENVCGWKASHRSHDKLRGHWKHHRNHAFSLRALERMLNLTDEQKKQVDEIVDATKPKIKAIREEQRTKIRAVFDDVRNQIRPLLSPDQQKVFDEAHELRERSQKLRQDAWKLHQEGDKSP
ncbi:MAG TPA: hypothetical protein VIT23_08775 [Terrimicrobiaceae bacterium]